MMAPTCMQQAMQPGAQPAVSAVGCCNDTWLLRELYSNGVCCVVAAIEPCTC